MFQKVGNESVNKAQVRKRKPQNKSVRLKIDVPLLLTTIILAVFGILMVYSASWDYAIRLGEAAHYFISRQIIFLIVGIIAAVILTFFDYHFWRTLAVPLIGLTIVLLIGVLFFGEIRNNAVRSLFGGSVQPSELAKIVTVIYLAVWLYAKRDQLHDITLGLIPLAGILGIVGGLIFIQPDLSAFLTIFLLGGIMFFLAGGDLRQIVLLVLVAALFGWVVVAINTTGGERVQSYLAGLRDPFQASYHVRRSIEAFANGGWVGVGIGKSVTKLTGLPVPPTDSIFAVVGEETGVFGAITMVVLYTIMLWRGLIIARRAPDRLGTLLAAGLSFWLALEAYINMAVMVNLLPFAGNALPFMSAGGSNLLVSLAAIGILMNISRLSAPADGKEGNPYGAVVDLRRWNRWRRVPRARRARSAK
jgi:cell division protein FtsW